jgi:thiamine kinase-like enzyme
MLDAIEEALIQLDIPIQHGELLNANILWSHNVSFMIETRNGSGIFLKIVPSGVAQLENEMKKLQFAYSHLPKHVPKPLGFVTESGLDILVTSLERGKILAKETGTKESLQDQAIAVEFLACASNQFRKEPDVATRHDLVKRVAIYDDTIASYLEAPEVRSELEKVPASLQHSDFVRSNILIDKSGRAIVLDWEDFGIVDFAGFDFVLFFGSILQHNAQEILKWFERSEVAAMLGQIQQVSNPDMRGFRKLLPIYYGIFALLKIENGYRNFIKAKSLETTRQLVHLVSSSS